jgi:ABC-type nitrate/sulfonate/bicarbonate transport system substrate-binding protein
MSSHLASGFSTEPSTSRSASTGFFVASSWDRSQHQRRRRRGAALAATAAVGLALSGCAGGGSPGGGGEAGGSFTVAVIEPDITTVPILAALDTVREKGYEIEVVELAEPELAIEGLANGEYAISAESTSPALIAIQQGAPIKIIADVIGNQWAVYGQDDIAECDDLAGQPFGIFSEGSVATAMVRSWVAQNCTAGEPEYLVIGGSDVRAQALLNDQINATALEIADIVTLQATGTEFTLVADFKEQLPDLHPQTVYAGDSFLSENAEAAQLFVDALIAEHEQINADPEYLVGLVEEYLPDSVDETLPDIAAAYVDAGLFNAAALTEENMQGTIDFFIGAGVFDEGMSVEQAADLSLLG